jgi:hypothetical protein
MKAEAGRVSVTEALELLRPTYKPHDAAAQLTLTTHANKCRLWCNGNLLAPDHIARALRIVAHIEKDGRCWGEVVSSTHSAWQLVTVKGPVVNGQGEHELDADEVKALLPQPQKSTGAPGRRRGPVTTHDWHYIDGEIARRCVDKTGRVLVPKSENRLATAMLNWLPTQGIDPPARSAMREAVKHICAALRKAQK